MGYGSIGDTVALGNGVRMPRLGLGTWRSSEGPEVERSVRWALEAIYASGRAKAIGVSNFLVHHLEDLLRDATVVPMVNQVELHPRLVQRELTDHCQRYGIVPEAWSPLMKGKVADIPQIRELAARYGKTPAQVVLRWNLQRGIVTIPKSVRRERLAENADLFDFELTPQDLDAIDRLDEGERLGAHPDHFTF